MSDHRDAISSLKYFHFTTFFDIVNCQHSLTHIITAELHQLLFILKIFLLMTSVHIICTILQTITCENSKRKRPMGHIAHLRNKFKSINTFEQSYDYILAWIGEGKTHYLLFENWMVLISKALNPLHRRMLCAKIWLVLRYLICQCIFPIWTRGLLIFFANR